MLAGGGAIFNGAGGGTGFDDEGYSAALESAGGSTDAVDPNDFVTEPEVTPTIAGVPIYYHLRGHLGRLMVTAGLEFALGVTPEPDPSPSDDPETGFTFGTESTALVPSADCPGSCWVDYVPSGPHDDFTVAKTRKWQRLIFGGVGVVLFKDAPLGFGPRGWIRFGHYNAPNAFDLTAHIGITENIPINERKGGQVGEGTVGRIAPIVDVDLFAGAMFPFGDSALVEKTALFTFGITAGAGLTF